MFTLEQAMKANRQSRGTPHSVLNLGAGWEWVVNGMTRPLYPRERDAVPILQESMWIQGSVWMGAENLTPTVCYCVQEKSN
jgi:hypothetical protein